MPDIQYPDSTPKCNKLPLTFQKIHLVVSVLFLLFCHNSISCNRVEISTGRDTFPIKNKHYLIHIHMWDQSCVNYTSLIPSLQKGWFHTTPVLSCWRVPRLGGSLWAQGSHYFVIYIDVIKKNRTGLSLTRYRSSQQLFAEHSLQQELDQILPLIYQLTIQ